MLIFIDIFNHYFIKYLFIYSCVVWKTIIIILLSSFYLVISILDTNCDPDLIDIPIPGNDDAVRSIKLIVNSLTDSILKGQTKLNETK